MSGIDWDACDVLVKSLASKYTAEGIDLEDLQQEGRLAVLEAHHLYRPEMGVSLNTFLGRRIRDALRAFAGHNADALEVSRSWIAESISEGLEGGLKASTKGECEALRAFHGRDKYKKPRRVIETVRATVSLDEGRDGNTEGDSSALNLHEQIGLAAGQESAFDLKETANKAQAIAATKRAPQKTTGTTRKNSGAGDFERIAALRAQGFTYAEIGKQIGKSMRATMMAFRRGAKAVNSAA